MPSGQSLLLLPLRAASVLHADGDAEEVTTARRRRQEAAAAAGGDGATGRRWRGGRGDDLPRGHRGA
eukprot:6666403-Prymnesium_polylepis.1